MERALKNNEKIYRISLAEEKASEIIALMNNESITYELQKEEVNLVWSKLYVEKYKNKIKYALIFDIIGVGETLVYNANYSFKKIGINIPFIHLVNMI